MNPAHLHLALNHLPIMGVPLAFLVLLWGYIRKESAVLRVGMILAVLIGIATVPVYLSGEPAEDKVEQIQGVEKSLIEPHEDAATIALILTSISALGSLFILIRRRGVPTPSPEVALLLALLAVNAGALFWTGLKGGAIHHQEIRTENFSSTFTT